jgi:circadian clock protein KaiC
MMKIGLDFAPSILERKVAVLDLSVATEADVQECLNKILETVKSLNAKRLVIDSFTAMALPIKTDIERRFLLHLLYRFIQRTGCTTIIVTDIPWGMSRIGYGIEEFIADGIILMQNYYEEGNLRRALRILKMRGVNHSRETHYYEIGDGGIKIIKEKLSARRRVRRSKAAQPSEFREIELTAQR